MAVNLKRARGQSGHASSQGVEDKRQTKNVSRAVQVPGPQTKRHPEKGGKLNTSQAGSVAASRAAVGQFLSVSREEFILRTR